MDPMEVSFGIVDKLSSLISSIKIEIQESKPKLPFLQIALSSQPALIKYGIENRTIYF